MISTAGKVIIKKKTHISFWALFIKHRVYFTNWNTCFCLFVIKEVITCCLYSLQWWAICILADPPALNMCPPILKVIWRIWELILCSDQDMKLLLKRTFLCSGLQILEFSDFHKDLGLRFVFPLDHSCFIQLLLDGLVMKCLWRINKVLTAPFYGSLQ